ncbi:MAG: hypothetical protein J7483_07135 [Novosphingobium sp.]|nr:hypothetical protein [Novosphingobium sp.]
MVAIAGLVGREGRDGEQDVAALRRVLPFHGARDSRLGDACFQGIATHADRGPQPVVARSAEGVSVLAVSRFDARDELARALGTPSGAGDATLLLAAYSRWGAGLVDHLSGDFCFLLWDARARTLLAATDQFGARPLFYREGAGGLAISNSLTALRDSDPGRALDEGSIGEMLALGTIADPGATFYRSIRRLPEAHLLQWQGGALSVSRYWSPSIDGPLDYRPRAALTEEFRDLFLQAVADRLPAEGQVGILMSGGLDSAAVAAAARHRLGPDEAAARLHAYTVVFSDFPEQEGYYSGLVARHLGIAQTLITAEDSLNRPKLSRREFLPAEPGAELDGSPPAYAAIAVAQTGGALLGGVGGDPLLMRTGSSLTAMAGQEGWRMPSRLVQSAQRYGRIPTPALRAFLPWHRPAPLRIPGWIEPGFAARIGLAERVEAAQRSWSQARAGRVANTHLSRILGMGAASQSRLTLETGSPFCDVRLLAFALRLPEPVLRAKQVLRDAMAPLLPAEIVRRPKTSLGLATLKTVREPVVTERILAAMRDAEGIGAYVDPMRFQETLTSPAPADAFRIADAEAFFRWFAQWQEDRARAPADGHGPAGRLGQSALGDS